MAVNIPGIVSIAVFYLVILGIGIWAGRKSKKSTDMVQVLLADRNIGMVISLFTITATWVGGGFINGTSEMMALKGLAWTQAPFGYSLALVICGVVFCPKMRSSNYITMFDPFQEKYGNKVGALMCIPQFFGDLFWSAAILSALGSTVHIVLDLDQTMSIIISAIISVLYTFIGGLWSVAYTDVVQLVCLAVGLTVACPFVMTHPSVNATIMEEKWVGEVDVPQAGHYVDIFLLLILGGTTWQEVYQRILACRSSEQARSATIIAGFFCLLLSLPPTAIGIAGAAIDWNQTEYTGEVPIPKEKMAVILPLCLQYLCPLPVSIVGLGAIAAAVMSSTDSSILVTASVFTKNIYKCLIRPQASGRELIWVMRVTVLVAGAGATVLAILANSVYGLFVLCSDLMYVVLFPQFVCVLFLQSSNAYGSLIAFIFSVVIRIGAGEPLIGMPTFIEFPMFIDGEQMFPFRTFTCVLSMVIIYTVSLTTRILFVKGVVDAKYDFLDCFREDKSKVKIALETEVEEMISTQTETERLSEKENSPIVEETPFPLKENR